MATQIASYRQEREGLTLDRMGNSKKDDPAYATAKHVAKTGLYIWGYLVLAVVVVMAVRQMSGY